MKNESKDSISCNFLEGPDSCWSLYFTYKREEESGRSKEEEEGEEEGGVGRLEARREYEKG